MKTKKTMVIDEELLAQAREACGAATDTAAVHEGLQELVRSAARRRMQALLGTIKETGPLDVPRRREPPAKRPRSRSRRRAA
jgi:Arc/MetJ family transcription regulator